MQIDPLDRMIGSTENRTYSQYKIILIACTLGILAVIGYVFIARQDATNYAIAADVVERLAPETRTIAHRLYDEPCNRTLAQEFANDLLNADEHKALIAFYKGTEKQCGQNKEMLPLVLLAQLRSSQFFDAEQTANALAIEFPGDPDVFGWRAEARQGQGNLKGAYSDLQKALLLFPDPSKVALSVYYDLARLAGKMGLPCEASATLRDFIAFDPEQRKTQQLTTLMQEWQSQGSCPLLFGNGTALLRYDPNASAIIVSAKINGVPARVIVDTGASRTFLSQQFAERAGIKSSDLQEEIVSTANGDALVSGGRVQNISVGNAFADNIPVFIQKTTGQSLGDNIDGLLGLSFLGNFQVQISNGALELKPFN